MPRYIDADALQVDCMRRYCGDCDCRNGLKCRACWVDDMLGEVDNAPTVSPDEVRGVGEWKQKEIINLEDTTIEQMQSACCSICGKYHTTPFSYYFTEYNYCPSCGAKMEVNKDV